MGETERMRAFGRHKVKQVKAQRNVDVTSAQAKSAAIETLRSGAVTDIAATNYAAATTKLGTMATRITELNAILTTMSAADRPYGSSGPNVGPILTNLGQAKTAAALHTTQGRTDATTAFNAAKTKVNALTSENKTDAITAIDAGIANIALATTPGDNAAIVNADAAIAAVNQF